MGGLHPIGYSTVGWHFNGRAPGERQTLVGSTVQIFYERTACWRRDGSQQQAVKAYTGFVHRLGTLHPLGERHTAVLLVLRQAVHCLSNRGLRHFVMPQANIEGVRGGFDGFDGGFKSDGVRSEPPSSTPGELPALSSRSAQSSETLLHVCSVRLVPIVCGPWKTFGDTYSVGNGVHSVRLRMPGSSTEGSALPASTKMSSEYELFDITSAMDWYEGDGELLGGSPPARVPEAPFEQDLLQCLDPFSREEHQATDAAWCSKALSSSYDMGGTSPPSAMIPTGSSMDRRHPSGDPLRLPASCCTLC